MRWFLCFLYIIKAHEVKSTKVVDIVLLHKHVTIQACKNNEAIQNTDYQKFTCIYMHP